MNILRYCRCHHTYKYIPLSVDAMKSLKVFLSSPSSLEIRKACVSTTRMRFELWHFSTLYFLLYEYSESDSIANCVVEEKSCVYEL